MIDSSNLETNFDEENEEKIIPPYSSNKTYFFTYN